MTRTEAGLVLAAEAKRFAGRGWMMGTAGNLSLRAGGSSPLRFFITASGKDKGELTPEDVAMAGVDGEPADDGPKPSAEAGLHARIYRRAQAGAIFHVHTVSAVSVAATAKRAGRAFVEVEGLEMLKGIERAAEGDLVRIPIVENSQDMRVLGDRFEKVFDTRTPGMLVASHGLYAWGKDAMQARHHVEIFEWLFQYLTATAR